MGAMPAGMGIWNSVRSRDPSRPPYAGRLTRSAALCALLVPALAATEAHAAGFYLQEQTPRGIGRANAGSAAVADDATTVFFNPAGMTHLEAAQVDLGVTVLLPVVDFSNRGTTATTPGTLGTAAPVTGNNGGNPFDPTPVPHLFVAYPVLNKQLWFGFALSAPFGLKLDYRDDWFGRYESTNTELKTIDLAPSVAYKINDMFSIGAGLDIQYASARLESRIPNPLTPGGPTAATDGNFLVEGESWAVGFNAGLTFSPVRGTRIGLHYRYGITQELEGDTSVTGLTGPLAGANGRTSMKADVKLPDVIGLGIAQQVTPQLTLLGQANYFTWDRYNEVRIRTAGAPDQVSPQNYENSWSFAVGAEYQLNQSWSLRGGFQYDESPTEDPRFFSTRVPDADRYYTSIGATYRLNDRISFDLAYAHVFLADAEINRTDTFFGGTPVASSVTTRGKAETHFDIVALKGSIKF